MNKGKRRGVQILFGVLLSALGLVLAFRGVEWSALGAALREVQVGWLLAAVVVEMITVLLNAVRWRWLFWPHYRPRVAHLFGVLNVAQLANTVLPGRLGLALRALLAPGWLKQSREQEDAPNRAIAVTTLMVEKVLEGVTLLPLGLLLFLLLDLPDWLRLSAVISGCVLLALLIAMAGGLRWGEKVLAYVSGSPIARFSNLLRSLLQGLDTLRSAQTGWQIWGWSLLYWLSVAAVNWLVIRAMGDQLWIGTSAEGRPVVAIEAALLLLFVLQIGVRIPSSPGNFGIFDYLGVVSLAVFGVEQSRALGVTLLLHLVFYLPPSLVGIGYLFWMSTGLGELWRALQNRDPSHSELSSAD